MSRLWVKILQAWMKNLGLVPQKALSNGSKSLPQANGAKEMDENGKAEAERKEEARKVASAALAAAKLAAKASTDGKVEVPFLSPHSQFL